MGLGASRGVVLPPVGPHLGNAAQTAALNQVDRIAKVRPAALLHAALQNLLARTHRVGERGAFFDACG